LFESNRVSFAKFLNKTRKRKREKEGKEEKASGVDFGPQPKNGPWPSLHPLPNWYFPPFFFFADKWDPHISTDVVINLRPIISPEDSVIFSY
jgi:hypothetical protein